MIVLALTVTSCARMAPPPGGPEDKTAPEITLAFPAQESVSVPVKTDVVLEFSEPVNRPSVEASLYLSPEPGRRLRYRWSGRRLILDYLDPLPENRTIVVTVGAQAKDMQNNPLENSYTLAFSTGDHIDRGEMAGAALIPPKARSVTITAYQFSDTMPDPMIDAPDYRMQTAPDGSFDLGYLAPGKYRLFALEDKNLDGLWSPASEHIGSATSDVRAEEGSKPRVSFAPTLQDTTPLNILRAKQIDKWTVNFRMNHDVLIEQVNVRDSLKAYGALYHSSDTSSSASWFVFLDDSLKGDSATLEIVTFDTTLSGRFAVSAKPDTTHPAIAFTLPENRTMNRTMRDDVVIVFNEPILYEAIVDTVSAVLREDTTDLDVTVQQSDPASLTITTANGFRAGVKYVLSVPNVFVRDRSGNLWNDSLWTLSWFNYTADSLGNLEGRVRATESGPWLVELYAARGTEPEDVQFTNGTFAFSGFPAGDYRLRVIRDANMNQKFDTGSILPFTFSEPFQWHSDTVTVRPRWTADVEVLWTIATQQ